MSFDLDPVSSSRELHGLGVDILADFLLGSDVHIVVRATSEASPLFELHFKDS
jgi:hypothetical protein